MARRLQRTGGAAQVVPDALLARRGGAPVSVGVPVSVAVERGLPVYTMFATKASPSAFDQLELTLLPVGAAGNDAPRIGYGAELHTVDSKKLDYPKGRGRTSASLFTETSKMSCPSFSLPAGPTKELGTCPAANQSKTGGLREPGKVFTCDGCYSLEGNYIFPDVALAQAARLHWVRQLLDQNASGELLAGQLASAIADYAANATLAGSAEGLGTRLGTELGVWREGRIHVMANLPGIGKRWMPAVGTDLPPLTGFRSTTEMFAASGVRDGDVAGFFRIHDSGDFGVSGDAKTWTAYLSAWLRVAEQLPHVRFWAPSRMWMFKSTIPRSLPPNMTLRPSALHVDDPAPVVRGFSAGSAVSSHAGIDAGPVSAAGDPCYVCPVYAKKSGKSCTGSDCRACWIAKDLPVTYGWH